MYLLHVYIGVTSCRIHEFVLRHFIFFVCYPTLTDMSGFAHTHQYPLLSEYVEPFFAEVRAVFKDKSKTYSDTFFERLFPRFPEDDRVLQLGRQLEASLGAEEDVLKRQLKYVSASCSHRVNTKNQATSPNMMCGCLLIVNREELDGIVRARRCRDFVGL
jgi:hypothetical protein